MIFLNKKPFLCVFVLLGAAAITSAVVGGVSGGRASPRRSVGGGSTRKKRWFIEGILKDGVCVPFSRIGFFAAAAGRTVSGEHKMHCRMFIFC